MCFHAKQTKDAQSVENRFNAKIESIETFKTNARINGFDFPQTPVILDIDSKSIKQCKWGLIPNWVKDEGIRKYTLNAKVETILEKPSFKEAVNQRCLVIVNGFYEWQWLDLKGKQKQQYEIGLENDALFAFAGIYDKWFNVKTEEIITSFSILTTEANEFMAQIHNSKKRMPVIISKEKENDWLNHKPVEYFLKDKINLIAKPIQENQINLLLW